MNRQAPAPSESVRTPWHLQTVRSVGALLAERSPRRLAAEPLLSAWSRQDIEAYLREHPDRARLREWVTDACRQIRCGAVVWGASRDWWAERFEVDPSEVDRLAREWNRLPFGRVRIADDRMMFACL